MYLTVVFLSSQLFFPKHEGIAFFWSIGKLLPDYMASRARRMLSSLLWKPEHSRVVNTSCGNAKIVNWHMGCCLHCNLGAVRLHNWSHFNLSLVMAVTEVCCVVFVHIVRQLYVFGAAQHSSWLHSPLMGGNWMSESV
jgi:hypothetical protein